MCTACTLVLFISAFLPIASSPCCLFIIMTSDLLSSCSDLWPRCCLLLADWDYYSVVMWPAGQRRVLICKCGSTSIHTLHCLCIICFTCLNSTDFFSVMKAIQMWTKRQLFRYRCASATCQHLCNPVQKQTFAPLNICFWLIYSGSKAL